jgi:hypothetical protein
MKNFYVFISAFWARSAVKLSRMVAVLLMALSVALTVHAQSVSPVSISPSSGSGSEQPFIATYIDPNSEMDVQSLSLFIMNGVAPDSESGWSASECILNYTVSSGVIQLVQDAGGEFLSNTAIAGTAQTVSNSQCTVLANLSSLTISGNSVTREEIDKASMFEEIVGTSPPLRTVLSRITKVAPTDSSVFITGETGTGKELVARAMHKRSKRSSRPFVSVNCAAIPRDLIPSELFGHGDKVMLSNWRDPPRPLEKLAERAIEGVL